MNYPDDDALAADLRTVIARLVKIVRNETRHEDLFSLTERSTLGLICQYGEILPSELAALEKVSAQSMSQIINKLIKAGFVKKVDSKEDKRKVIISIRPAGRKFVEQNRKEKQEWLAASIAEKLSKKEKEILGNAIGVLTRLVDLK